MAKSTLSFTIIILLTIVTVLSLQVNGLGGKVGGKQKITDVKSNKEVQDLGRYCVEQYNMKQSKHNGAKNLMFSRVVDAEEQVVSGIKYYLKIDVANPEGVPQIFDAIVVVKPWAKTKEILTFNPSPTN
ncbi:hypothetical protein LIER_44069 [Lithospermum erythrorhizon]|uniref:Cystatin domain-containing protein n=1 Tax=Lithospermum erythrorhizon TaxID=34254 RepID=A0AAV3P0K5_LITER